MFSPDVIEGIWPNIRRQVWDRMTQDQSLFDTSTHKLRGDLTKEQARAILILACKASKDAGLRLALSSDEQELMNRKFQAGQVRN